MKKQVKTIAIALLAAMTISTGFAKEHEDPKKVKSFDVGMYFDHHNGIIKTFVEKDSNTKLRISFQDENGVELGFTTVDKKTEKGMIPFNVNNLPSGSYQMEVSNGTESTIHELEISRPDPVQQVTFY
ncbi:hypothetical protein [Jiulongibacter sp. NS-SX5]|uniref:hypothetical protein n=1 Tax=Jiulongibacter sp. NS-SX5 TaxID=3463854 RepID=UPI004058146C